MEKLLLPTFQDRVTQGMDGEVLSTCCKQNAWTQGDYYTKTLTRKNEDGKI